MKNEFSFCFLQANCAKGKFSAYHAMYVHSAWKKNRQLTIKHSDNLAESLPSEIGWRTFYENATFQEILNDLKPDGINEMLILKMHEFDEYNEHTHCRREGNKILISLSPVVQKIFRGEIDNLDEYYKKRRPKEVLALEIIRDFPTAIFEKKYASVLYDVLTEANWSLNREAADKAKKLLIDHLIPLRPGGKIPVPENLQAVKDIMIELANYLSEKCKKYINSRTALSRNEKIDEELYGIIREWASGISDSRIGRLSITSLNTIVFSPPKFVNNLLLNHFGCKDLRTLGLN
jgi:hypothetical protein